jgi:hypothetical protein
MPVPTLTEPIPTPTNNFPHKTVTKNLRLFLLLCHIKTFFQQKKIGGKSTLPS